MFSLIDNIIRQHGLLGVALLMLIENLLPAIPSEVILPLAGFEAARGAFGDHGPLRAALAGGLGSILGGAAWYGLGRKMGLARALAWSDRYGRWTTVTPDSVRTGLEWFRRWGGPAVMIGRSLPGVRSFITFPAGVAAQPWPSFLIWSSVGALAWSALLVWSGYVLQEHYAEIRRWLDPVLDAFLAACLIVYLVRVAKHRS